MSVAGLALLAGEKPLLHGAAEAPLEFGVQLYMLRDLLAKDFERGLEQVAQTGVKHVEFAGFYDRPAAGLARLLRANGLVASSAHCIRAEMSQDELKAMIDYCGELKMPYMCAAAPIIRHLKLPITSMEQARQAIRQITLDDMRESADRFNRISESITRAGMRFAYHTHGMDFRRYGDILAFDDMVQRTDPKYVSFQLDFGNVVAVNEDPIAYLRKYPTRFCLGHLKDWTRRNTDDTEMIPPRAPFGEGVIDWKQMLQAGRRAGIQTYFIEQEEVTAQNAIEVLRQGYQYFRSLKDV
ncbi:MAG: sugar phosphate isomerase/epimerase [Bryobacterales bacterium]|nr:sugar phosphate isomerase/epimerase [Bryobacterales bacterium]